MSKDKEESTNIIGEDELLKELGIIKDEVEEETPSLEKDLGIQTNDEESEKDEEVVGNNNKDQTEKEEIEDPNEATKKEEVKNTEQEVLKKFGVTDSIEILISNGMWKDVAVKYGDKEYENITQLLENEKPSKELFNSISEVQKELMEKELKESYISLKGKDDTKVKLINAILSDVDYEDLLTYNKNVVEPVKKVDFTSVKPEVVEGFVRQCLKDIDNIPDKYLEVELQELRNDLKLVEKAEEFQNKVIENFNNEIELRERTKKELEQKELEETNKAIKSFKKTLREDKFPDSFAQKASNLRFLKDEKGRYHYENLIKDKIKNEDFAKKFFHFLLDDEDFIKKATSKVKTKTATKTLELVSIVPKKGASKATKLKDDGGDDSELLKEIGIIK